MKMQFILSQLDWRERMLIIYLSAGSFFVHDYFHPGEYLLSFLAVLLIAYAVYCTVARFRLPPKFRDNADLQYFWKHCTPEQRKKLWE